MRTFHFYSVDYDAEGRRTIKNARDDLGKRFNCRGAGESRKVRERERGRGIITLKMYIYRIIMNDFVFVKDTWGSIFSLSLRFRVYGIC